jgi:anti-sigma factor RsiW
VTCEEFRALVPAPPEPGGDFDRHCEECAECRRLLRSDGALDEREREKLFESASAAFTARLLGRVGEARLRRRWVRRLAVTAVLASLAASAFLFSRGKRGGTEELLVGDHLDYASLESPAQFATADPSLLSRWFVGRLRFEVDVPRLTEAQLLGGRRCRLAGLDAALALYEAHGRRLSLFVLPREAPFRELPCRKSVRGVNLLVVERRGLRYALVGPVDFASLEAWALDLSPERSS